MSAPQDLTLTPAEEQEKWLAEAGQNVKQHAFYMKRAIDDDNFREALKHANAMLIELRTSRLSPQKYYELYMRALDELRYLEVFFSDLCANGRSTAELYELVQHAGNIVPRLYLMLTVGSVFIASKDAPAKDVLKDMVEMARGVQHPLRGLFLRAYLLQVVKDKLPDTGSEYEGEGGDVRDAVDFLLQNFTEMNKLWVRMQHQGPARLKEKREKERQELRDLVGKNLLTLSQLEGVDLELYKDTVLPKVLEQVVNCKDEIGQTYLMDAIIQVFPDDFHLHTLDLLNNAIAQLRNSVRTSTVLANLMQRLAQAAVASPEMIPEFQEVQAFQKLSAAVTKASETQSEMAVVDLVTLYQSLMTFVVKVHKADLSMVDLVLQGCAAALSKRTEPLTPKAVKELVALLSAPLAEYDVVSILSLNNYPDVMALLDEGVRKDMAVTIIKAVINSNTILSSVAQVDMLFEFIMQLIQDKDEEGAGEEAEDDEDFQEQQNLVAKLVMFLHSDDLDTMFKILVTIRRHFGTGGPKRLKYTLPPTIFAALRLVRKVHQAALAHEASPEDAPAPPPISIKKVFQFLMQTCQVLPDNGCRPETSVRLYLQCALAANECRREDILYAFFEQAFTIYEEEVSDSKQQVSALQLFIGVLYQCTSFGPDNREALLHKCTVYSSRLLKKPDQCRAAYSCSHLFWGPAEEGQMGDKVLLCLKRALKYANAAQQVAQAARAQESNSATLFVEIFNKYLYFLDAGNEKVTPEILEGLMELITNEMNTNEGGPNAAAVEAFYNSTLQHIRHQKAQGTEVGARYEGLNV